MTNEKKKRPSPRPFGVLPFSRRASVVWAVVVVALLAAGSPFMLDRLLNGMASAGPSNTTPWGLWVVVYIWFSGLAGGMYLLSSLTYLFRLPRFAPVARLALCGSIVSLMLSMIFIGIDLGSLRHSLNTMLFFHWSSPLSWEIKGYLFFLAVSVAQFVLVVLNDRPPTRRARRLAARAGAPGGPAGGDLVRKGNFNLVVRVLAGVGVATSFVGPPGGTGMFFAAVKARSLWTGGITTVLFYIVAVVTSAAFLLIGYRALRRLRSEKPDEAACTGLVFIMAATLAALAFCVFFELATPLFSGDPRITGAMANMAAGPLAGMFWVGEIGLCFVAPTVLLAVGTARRLRALQMAAAASILAGIFALRYVFVVAGFSVPLLAGMPSPLYLPTLSEVMVGVFVVGIGVALYGLGARFLPVERAGASEGLPVERAGASESRPAGGRASGPSGKESIEGAARLAGWEGNNGAEG